MKELIPTKQIEQVAILAVSGAVSYQAIAYVLGTSYNRVKYILSVLEISLRSIRNLAEPEARARALGLLRSNNREVKGNVRRQASTPRSRTRWRASTRKAC